MMTITELSNEDRALIARLLEDHLIPLEMLDGVQVEFLKSQALVRETSDHMIMLTMSGRTAAEAATSAPVAKPHANGNGSAPPDAAVARRQLETPLSDKSLETLRAVYAAGDVGTSVRAIKAHMLTLKKLRNLKLIRQQNDQLFITAAGAARLAAEGPRAVERFAAAYEDVGAQFAATEQEGNTDDTQELPQVEVEITVSADTPAEAAETIREVADAVAEGLIGSRPAIAATPGEYQDMLHDEESMTPQWAPDDADDAPEDVDNGCGDCFDCLDKRVLHMLMAARPEVAAIYQAEAARENAEMLRDSLLRAFGGG